MHLLLFISQVEIWLEKLYGEQQIPSYEINQQTISILYDLMKKNERQDEWTTALIADLQQKIEEYTVEGKLETLCKYQNL